MNYVAEDIIKHYGMPRRSGRFPWGSGKNPYQRGRDFIFRVNELKKEGLSEKEIADYIGLTTTQLRAQIGLANAERRTQEVETAKSLRDKGYSLNEIASKMGYKNDSSIRSLLNVEAEARMNQVKNTVDFLKKQVDEKGMIDVGVGIERDLGLNSREKLNQVLYILELEGYKVYGGGVPQVTNPGKQTNMKVLCVPGTEHKEIYNFEKIHSITDYTSHDNGKTFDVLQYPASMDSKRLNIRYAEDGGSEKDGLIEIRRNVEDLSLGNSKYAQVRILVDDNKYLKGMAVYSDNLPDGVDIIFNTNKSKSVPPDKVLKNITDNPDNPFGSLIKANGQSFYISKDGERKLSLINKRAEEGDWKDWDNTLPSQFLSKQRLSLINKQLNLAVADKKAEFDEIMALNNPTVKKHLLYSFADDCDAAAVHLKAAALPRQSYQVILPISSLKDHEVYAPNYIPGEQVALVRFPHGGTFEIPILTVTDKNKESKKIIGTTPIDAIGINSKVAQRLSGADFDGDTVMVIPIGKNVKITSHPPLTELEGFDPFISYGGKKEGTFKPMRNTQTEMGKISNLITDMTLMGANQREIAKAVKHSMVVIDAEKHGLDYKQSEKDNNIQALKKKYQGTYSDTGKYSEGAATLISRAKSQQPVTKRQGSPKIDPDTGELVWKTVDEPFYIHPKTGKKTERLQRSTKMYETKDAHSLVSKANTPQERAYADYANTMKALGNQARKEILTTGKIKYDSTAKKTYQAEVDNLTAQLNVALKNRPRERQAQTIANAAIKSIKLDNPNMTKGEISKISQQELTRARNLVGAKRIPIEVSDRAWDAIQAGAITENTLNKILANIDIDVLRQRATPRVTQSLSQAKINKISSMAASGYSLAEIASAIGVSTSTVSKYLSGKD